METGPWFEVSAERQEGEGGGGGFRLEIGTVTPYPLHHDRFRDILFSVLLV